jgi:hypothetical protein
MALILKDRVQETSTTTGTGTLTLAGAVTQFQTFSSAIGNGNTTYYTIYNAGGTEWEVGIGTVGAGTLSRDTVLSSSNAGSLVNFTGTLYVFGDYPADKAVFKDASGNVTGYAISGGTINNTVIGGTTPVAGTFTNLTANDNVILGFSNTDTLAVNGRITTDLEPSANNSKDIGTNGRNWRDAFFGRTLHTVNLELTGTTSFDGAQGTAGQVLTSAGTGATPTWTTPTTGTVTSVTATAPITSSGGATPDIAMPAATGSVNGYLTSTDWTTFNSKGSGTVTSVDTTGTVNGITLTGGPITSSGTITLGGTLSNVSLTTQVTGTLPVANGGTGLTSSGTAGYVLTSDGTGWVSQAVTPTGSTYTRTSFTATAAQTTFTVAYTVGFVQVYLNGVFLNSTDFTATNGTTVVLATGATSGDIVETVAYNISNIGVASTATNLAGGIASQIPYQTSAGATAFIANGTSGQVLISNGASVPSWSSTITSPTLVTPVLGTPSSGNLSSCTADGTNAVGYLTIPQNSQSAAYTLVLADSGKQIFHPSADTTARTFTIPANGTVAFPVGTAVTFINQNGAGVITIAITTDTMRLAGAGTTGSRTLAANGIATAIKVTSTEWLISGTGLT